MVKADFTVNALSIMAIPWKIEETWLALLLMGYYYLWDKIDEKSINI